MSAVSPQPGRRALTEADMGLISRVVDAIHPDDRRYYGRHITVEEIEESHYRWNTLPPRRMRFCDRCGSEVRWFREGAVFDVGTGAPSHRYHLKCPHFGDMEYERQRLSEFEQNHPNRSRIVVLHSDMHYDSHLYATVADDRESFANAELR